MLGFALKGLCKRLRNSSNEVEIKRFKWSKTDYFWCTVSNNQAWTSEAIQAATDCLGAGLWRKL